MPTAKKEIQELLAEQPEDISREELIRKLTFELMVSRGISDSENRRIISNEEMGNRIKRWQK